MYTIPDIEKIAKIATDTLEIVYKTYFPKLEPPHITNGIVSAVLDAFDQINPEKVNLP